MPRKLRVNGNSPPWVKAMMLNFGMDPDRMSRSGTTVSGVHLCSLPSSSAKKKTTTRNPKREHDGNDQLAICVRERDQGCSALSGS